MNFCQTSRFALPLQQLVTVFFTLYEFQMSSLPHLKRSHLPLPVMHFLIYAPHKAQIVLLYITVIQGIQTCWQTQSIKRKALHNTVST